MASGEQVTAGLLPIVFQSIGIPARSPPWQGWQIPIETSGAHGAARILKIDGSKSASISPSAARSRWWPASRACTRPRGASRRWAAAARTRAQVALAAAPGGGALRHLHDVDGVYTTDPRIVAKAKRLDRVSYEEMLEMASLGAKVLQVRSVELAMLYGVRT